jgi:hypothetical protein
MLRLTVDLEVCEHLVTRLRSPEYEPSGSPEILNQHQVGSAADEPAVENRLTIR